MKRFALVLVVAVFAAVSAGDDARAAIIASDDFGYADGPLAGSNGGTGWAGAWTDFNGTPATVTGGAAQVSFTAAGGFAASQADRFIGAGALTSAWIRFTAQKTASLGISDSFGGIGLFEGGSEKGLIGNYWPGVAVDAWGAGSNGSQGEVAGELVTTLSDVVVYVDGAETKLWVNNNPASLGAPDATGGGVGQFDRLILRAGTSTDGLETWQFDNLVIGETAADVGVAIPEPAGAVLVLLALLGSTSGMRRGIA